MSMSLTFKIMSTTNEHLWIDDIENKLNESEFVYGNGLDDYKGMNEPESETEWRYECDELKTGGHL